MSDTNPAERGERLFQRDNPILETPELRRVLALPQRDWSTGYGAPIDTLVSVLSASFRRPGSTATLRPVQAAALSEIYSCGGALLPVSVGGGKTLVTFLAPKVLSAKRPLLMVPAKLRDKTHREHTKLQVDWLLPAIRVESYEMLSRENNAEFLTNYQPDLIICDEGHRLKNPSAAVSRRFTRYIRAKRPHVIVLSGTVTRRSLMDYWHLLRSCLGDAHAPVPSDWTEAMQWGDALDNHGGDKRTAPGALAQLLDPGEPATLDNVRRGFQRRLTGTPGVIATSAMSYGGSIYLSGVKPDLKAMAPHFAKLRDGWCTPDDHPFSEAVDLWRHARELACGFYYRWNPRPPQGWLTERKAWCKFVRSVLRHSRTLDTELQLVNAIRRGEYPHGVEPLAAWVGVRDTFEPHQEAVWCDSATLHLAAEWLAKHRGIAWVEHRAFGEKLSKLTGRPYYGQGGLSSDKRSIEDETGACIASIQANGEGRNLQRFSDNFVVSLPPSGATWEQLIGRTHRSGQTADEVTFEVVMGCQEQVEGMARALSDARYIETTTGQLQKLNVADVSDLWPDSFS